MARKYFGTDGIRGTANQFPMTADTALRIGAAAGRHFRKDGLNGHRVVIRQGHPPLGLYAGKRADRRSHIDRDERAAAGADPDARGRLSHPLDARRSRHHDLGEPQSSP